MPFAEAAGPGWSEFSLRFGEAVLRGRLPASSLGDVLRPSVSEGLRNPEATLSGLLAAPCSGKPLADLASGRRRVLILCDDATRPTPTARLLPSLVEALKTGGVEEAGIRVLFATGSHRPLNEEEAIRKLGPSWSRRLRWESHRWKGPLLSRGVTSGGTPVEVNPLLGEADLVVGIGSVLPHRYCGWSGGGKLVLPGVSGGEGVLRVHRLLAEDPEIRLGSEENRALAETREAAYRAGLLFLVQTVCGGRGRLVSLHAGELVPAHREAVASARRCFGAPCAPADVVVAGAWPEDQDLWQAGKALYAAERAVRPGGLVILVAEVPEGWGGHEAYREGFTRSCGEIRDKLRMESSPDLLGWAGAYATALVREKARIWIVTGRRGAAAVEGTGMRVFPNLQEALSSAGRLYPEGRFLVMSEAPLMLPLGEGEIR